MQYGVVAVIEVKWVGTARTMENHPMCHLLDVMDPTGHQMARSYLRHQAGCMIGTSLHCHPESCRACLSTNWQLLNQCLREIVELLIRQMVEVMCGSG